MIELRNIKEIRGESFKDYLAIKAYSNSFLKAEVNGVAPEFKGSDKVRLGSMVDEILTEPDKVDMTSDLYQVAKPMATAILKEFGYDIWTRLESQLSFIAEMHMTGLVMPIKGRLDKFGLNRVWDLKVSHVKEKQLDSLIQHMGYKNQMWLYSKAMRVEQAILIFYLVPEKKVVFKTIDTSSNHNKFFESKILKFGK